MLYLTLVAGLILLVLGGDGLVRGAVAIARHFNLSPLLIGLTLVGFGTSTPELVTSLQAAFAGSPGIALGNVVGSNIANILLILGLAAVIAPIPAARSTLLRDGSAVAGVTLAAAALLWIGEISRPVGVGLVLFLIAYLALSYRMDRAGQDAAAEMHAAEGAAIDAPMKLWLAALFVAGGLAMTIFGARFLVTSAIDLARIAGISETVIGVTIVAIGTSLPELVVSVMAAARRQSDVAFGNVIGSNIFNLAGILGVTALVHPLPVPPDLLRLDLWVLLAATAALLAFSASHWRIGRTEGAVLLVGYGGYLAALASTGGL